MEVRSVIRAAILGLCLLAALAACALTPQEIAGYTDGLTAHDALTRQRAAQVLLTGGATAPVVEALQYARADVRATAASAIGAALTDEVVTTLCTLLTTDPDVTVRRNAARSLVNVKDMPHQPAVIAALSTAALQDRFKSVYEAAFQALTMADDATRLTICEQAINNPGDDRAYFAIQYLPNSVSADYLISLLKDPRYTGCLAPLAWKCAASHATTAITPLHAYFDTTDTFPQWREEMLVALVYLGDQQVSPILIDRLQTAKAYLSGRETAVLLAKLAPPAQLPALVKLTGDADLWRKEYAYLALGGYDNPQATNLLYAALTGDDRDTAIAACRAFVYSPSKDAGDILLNRFVKNTEPLLDHEIFTALLMRGDARVLAPCIAYMEGQDMVKSLEPFELPEPVAKSIAAWAKSMMASFMEPGGNPGMAAHFFAQGLLRAGRLNVFTRYMARLAPCADLTMDVEACRPYDTALLARVSHLSRVKPPTVGRP